MKKAAGIIVLAGLIGVNIWLWPALWSEVTANKAVTAESGETAADGSEEISEETKEAGVPFQLKFEEDIWKVEWQEEEIMLSMNPDQVTERIGTPESTLIYDDFTPNMGEEETRAIRHIYDKLSIYYLSQTGAANTITITAAPKILEEAWWDGILPENRILKNYRITLGDQQLFIYIEESGMVTITITAKAEASQ